MRLIILQILYKITYLTFFVGGALLSFYKVGLFAGLLDKDQFGLYVLVMSVYIYLLYFFSLGANEYLLKVGSREEAHENKQRIRNVALNHGFLTLVLAVLLLKPFTLFLELEFQKVYDAAAFMAVSAFIFSILETYFRVEGALLKFSGMMMFKSILAVVIISLWGDLQGVGQAIYIEVISIAIVIAIVFVYLVLCGHRFPIMISKQHLKDVLRDGYPFCFSVMLRNSVAVVDKVFVSVLLGTVLLGYYGFVFIIYQAGVLASGVIMSAVGPKILLATQDKTILEKVKGNLLLITFFLAVAGALLYPFADVIYRWGVANYFESYNDSLTYELFLVIYVATLVAFISSIWDWIFISQSKEAIVVKFSFYSLGLFLIGLLFILLQGGGVFDVAVVFLLSKSFFLGLQLAYMYRRGGLCSL